MERILYRIENAFIMVVAFYVFLIYGTTWTGFLIFLALPKLLHLLPSAWLKNKVYELVHRTLVSLLHSYSIAVIVALFTFLFLDLVLWSILGWIIHIAIDRVIKYREKDVPHPLFQTRG
ncbi:DUF4260 family protein [Ammoniphilus sp. CFH 90114]|uniref:DUF4260 family protein n=1 Tax=Ammoniphilus sp. CFH 90114 TaxID=2493665 RepID=UPI00100FF686|nr:DUF4260 family protein [Ammoniphilus sp. CFH 90114]RXT13508.1 hypothetical protein EIZ39_04970 [Ammoniphilus sp. CFH 90114]